MFHNDLVCLYFINTILWDELEVGGNKKIQLLKVLRVQ